ncbi:MAG: 2-phosphosulfolactate phosphatase [Bacteroidetes bacterium]|nr:2-phosphosulfolactate phosphatase [Bacteroidota bacterium]
MSKNLEVILTPAICSNFSFENKTVVIIDVLRATSTIAFALNRGFKKVITCRDVELARSLKNQQSLVAGERNGDKIPGFDLGNSPYEIANLETIPENLVLTSTNGTKSVEIAIQSGAEEILCGALVNVQSLADYINRNNNDIILFCAGWKDHENIEDTYMAGCLIDKLNHCSLVNDSAFMASSIYQSHQNNSLIFLEKANHYQRLMRKGNASDIEVCLQESSLSVVPKLISHQNDISIFTKA